MLTLVSTRHSHSSVRCGTGVMVVAFVLLRTWSMCRELDGRCHREMVESMPQAPSRNVGHLTIYSAGKIVKI